MWRARGRKVRRVLKRSRTWIRGRWMMGILLGSEVQEEGFLPFQDRLRLLSPLDRVVGVGALADHQEEGWGSVG